MVQESEAADLKPVFTIEGVTYAFIAYRNVYMLAVTRRNCNVATAVYFLHCLRKVLCSYLGDLDEEAIRDNFVIIYELLDETMDFGYPQITDSDVSGSPRIPRRLRGLTSRWSSTPREPCPCCSRRF